MAVSVGTNSYVTVQEVDDYFEDRFTQTDWSSIDPAVKSKLVVSAADILDRAFSWSGTKTDPDQVMSFPVDGETEVPVEVKNAQCEISLEVYESKGALLLENPKLIKTDKVTAEFFEGSNSFPQYIINMLKDLGYYRTSDTIQVVSLLR